MAEVLQIIRIVTILFVVCFAVMIVWVLWLFSALSAKIAANKSRIDAFDKYIIQLKAKSLPDQSGVFKQRRP